MPKNNWVSVEDRLPEYDDKILVACKNFIDTPGKIMYTSLFIRCGKRTATNKHGNVFHVDGENGSFSDKCGLGIITHWMPLPDPPEEK